MSVCTPIARSSLIANYDLLSTDITNNLRLLVVGPDYAYRQYVAATAYNKIGPYVNATGVEANWPNLGVDEVADSTHAYADIVNALVNFHAESGAPGPTKGSQSGATPNAIVHNGGLTVWTGSGFSGLLSVALAVGDYIKLDDNAGKTLETKVAGFGYTLGVPNILILENNLPAGIAVNFNVSVAEIVPVASVPVANLTFTTAKIKVNAALTYATDRTVAAYSVIAGKTNTGTDLSVAYTNYRAFVTDLSTAVHEASTIAELAAHFTGYTEPESELGFAVLRALPVDYPSTNKVKFISVADTTSTGWQGAINLIQRRKDWSIIVPLTTDPTILGLFITLITYRNANYRYSEMFLSQALTTETIYVSGAGNTVLVDQSLTPGLNETVTADGGNLVPFTLAAAGDTIAIAGVPYTIAIKQSNSTVTITTAASAGAGQVLTYVKHPMTYEEQADAYGVASAAIANRAIMSVFPTAPEWNGVAVDGYLLAAAVAGLRNIAVPNQGLKGVQLETGWTVPETEYEFAAYIDDLANYGTFVVGPLEDSVGAAVETTNTTDQSSILNSKEMLTADDWAIRRYFSDLLSCYEGRSRVTLDTLGAIRSTAVSGLQFLMNTQVNVDLGPMVIRGTVSEPYQNPVTADNIVLPIDVVIATGLETLTLSITVDLDTTV